MTQRPDRSSKSARKGQEADRRKRGDALELLRTQYRSLAERYERLEAMINYIPDFIYAKDRDSRFLFANRAIVLNNGFTHVDEMIGLTDAEIHPMADARKIEEVERRVMETGEADLGGQEQRMKGEG